MNVRHSTNRVVRAASVRLHELNQRHPWSHNDHFHPWILRRLPRSRERALDVGCGRGELLDQLARRFEVAHGVDVDQQMRTAALARTAGRVNVTVGGEQLTELAGPYDVITMVAVLHHLDVAEALDQVRRLLSDGGRLLVVGLAPPATVLDNVVDIASAITNPVIGMIKHPQVAEPTDAEPTFPVRDPTMSYDELRTIAQRILPRVRLRRRLAFRHTLEWTKPE
ncbi:class I SAM-dependent methyltransferase [Propionibacteriaceae bacterium Y1700]|uniref:class I SAM-dependent methyltransferase n=1 Tax=Microlunatus sp. Y1700 TaxID=3418487 RepID=UPI003DA72380